MMLTAIQYVYDPLVDVDSKLCACGKIKVIVSTTCYHFVVQLLLWFRPIVKNIVVPNAVILLYLLFI